jgi:hypothetical protein
MEFANVCTVYHPAEGCNPGKFHLEYVISCVFLFLTKFTPVPWVLTSN